jgi:hypothetical protein
MKRGTKILLFSLLGGGLLILLLCGGLIFLAAKGLQEFPKVIAGADQFMDRIKANKIDEAYQSTIPEFQAKVDLEQFKAIVAKYPAFTNQTARSMAGMRLYQTGQGTRGYVQYNLSSPNNTLSLNLVLKEVNGAWKVESVNLP